MSFKSVKIVKDEEAWQDMRSKEKRIAFNFVRTLDSGGSGNLKVREGDTIAKPAPEMDLEPSVSARGVG